MVTTSKRTFRCLNFFRKYFEKLNIIYLLEVLVWIVDED